MPVPQVTNFVCLYLMSTVLRTEFMVRDEGEGTSKEPMHNRTAVG